MKDFEPITIEAYLLKALVLLAGKNDVRPYLNGVAINDGHLVATNGHFCGAIPIDVPDDVEVIIPTTIIEELLKGYTKHSIRKVKVIIEPNQISVLSNRMETPHITMKFVEPDGKFPEWQRIIPEHTVPLFSMKSQFNWEYLTLFNKVYYILADKKSTGFDNVRLVPNDMNTARIEMPAVPEFKGALMPCRL